MSLLVLAKRGYVLIVPEGSLRPGVPAVQLISRCGSGACADVEVDEAWLARVRAAQEQRGGGAQGEGTTDDLNAEEIKPYKQR